MSQSELFLPQKLKIAVIGGGTGTFTLLSALKFKTPQLIALVNMADDGGSTGVLRDELGALPPGDIRQCLVALSNTPELRDLFNYRFSEGSLKGHAFGNLFLTALEKMKGNFADGVEFASQLLNITGSVEPVTLSSVTLNMKISDGQVIVGEHNIGEALIKSDQERPEFWLTPEPEVNLRAVSAINQADIVIVAPGNLYGSLAPALISPGIQEALKSTKALKVYVCNLVTKPGQTDDFMVHDFADEINRLSGGNVLDAVLFNTEMPTKNLMKKYAKRGEVRVDYDESILKNTPYLAVGAPLLSGVVWQNKNGSHDPLASERTLIRHDSQAVADALIDLYEYLKDTEV